MSNLTRTFKPIPKDANLVTIDGVPSVRFKTNPGKQGCSRDVVSLLVSVFRG